MNYLHFFKSYSNFRLYGFWLHHRTERNLFYFWLPTPWPSLSPPFHFWVTSPPPPTWSLSSTGFPFRFQSARVLPSLPFYSFAVSSSHLGLVYLHLLHVLSSDLTQAQPQWPYLGPILWSGIYSPSLSWELVLNFQFSAGYFHPHVLLSMLKAQTIFLLLILWSV